MTHRLKTSDKLMNCLMKKQQECVRKDMKSGLESGVLKSEVMEGSCC